MKDTDPVDLTDTEAYDHWETVTIRYSDGDGMGHINNAVYAVWTEVARVTFTRTFMPSAPDWLDTVLVRQTMNFLKETQFPGEIRVGARLLRIGNTSYQSGYGIFRDNDCLATAECVNVFFDLRSRTSTLPPGPVREAMEKTLAAQVTN